MLIRTVRFHDTECLMFSDVVVIFMFIHVFCFGWIFAAKPQTNYWQILATDAPQQKSWEKYIKY